MTILLLISAGVAGLINIFCAAALTSAALKDEDKVVGLLLLATLAITLVMIFLGFAAGRLSA